MSATTQAEVHSLYGGEYQVSFSESSHRYKVNGDYKFSVTTALGVLSKENLIQWAANKSVEAFRLAYSAEAPWSPEVFETVCQQARYAHRTLKDDAAEVGKRVHAWISNYINVSNGWGGEGMPCDDLMRPSINAFIDWEEQAQPEYLHSERVVYSKAHDYCGTVDLVMMIDGKRVVADLKTGKPEQEYRNKGYTGRLRPRAEHLLQNAAYDQALGEEDGIYADSLAVIYIPLDGSIHVYQHEDVEFWRRGFLAVLETFRVLKSAGSINEFQAA